MSPGKTLEPHSPLIEDLLAALDNLFGLHPGFRAVHAKGLMCSGVFSPAAAAQSLTKAPHMTRPQTPVIVRLSNFAGIPTVPDNAPLGASPRGIAIRFQLAEHVHTDIIGHSHDGFPVRDGEQFLEFARALAASGPDAAKPTQIEQLIAKQPGVGHFLAAPKPIPTSFARESFFAVSAFRFLNAAGQVQHGRYSILPMAGNDYLSEEAAAEKSANFLQDEFRQRIAREPVRYRLVVQLAAAGDPLDDARIRWPETRPTIELGTVELDKMVDEQAPEMRKIIYDPIPRVDGIEPTDDPLFEVRAALYLLGGRRRRAAVTN